jgi:hypothetical protein
VFQTFTCYNPLLDSGCPIVTVGDAYVLPKGFIAESNGNHCILPPFTTKYSGISDSPRNWHVLLQQWVARQCWIWQGIIESRVLSGVPLIVISWMISSVSRPYKILVLLELWACHKLVSIYYWRYVAMSMSCVNCDRDHGLPHDSQKYWIYNSLTLTGNMNLQCVCLESMP